MLPPINTSLFWYQLVLQLNFLRKSSIEKPNFGIITIFTSKILNIGCKMLKVGKIYGTNILSFDTNH